MRGKKGPEFCTMHGCKRKHYAHDLCSKHYFQMRYLKINEAEEQGTLEDLCIVDGCERIKRANGYCSAHNMRVIRYGNPHTKISRAKNGKNTHKLLKKSHFLRDLNEDNKVTIERIEDYL